MTSDVFAGYLIPDAPGRFPARRNTVVGITGVLTAELSPAAVCPAAAAGPP